MSDTQWFYSDVNAQQQGPYLAEQIQQLAAQGVITPQTPLWHEGLENWISAGEVQGIFATPAPAPAPVVSTSPYAPPAQTPFGVAPAGGEFPIPFVKKSSFGLFLGSYIAALVFLIIGVILIASLAKATPETPPIQEADFSHIEEAGAPLDDGKKAEESAPLQEADSTLSDADTVKGIAAIVLFVLGGLCMTFGGIYSYIILYRAWFAIQAGGAQTTPGKAVGFMFIPLFNLYWMFIAYYGWANDWTRIRSKYSNLMAAPGIDSGTFLTGCILMLLFPLVGIFLFLAMISRMCAVTNYMASAYALAKRQSTGLTGTKFY